MAPAAFVRATRARRPPPRTSGQAATPEDRLLGNPAAIAVEGAKLCKSLAHLLQKDGL